MSDAKNAVAEQSANVKPEAKLPGKTALKATLRDSGTVALII